MSGCRERISRPGIEEYVWSLITILMRAMLSQEYQNHQVLYALARARSLARSLARALTRSSRLLLIRWRDTVVMILDGPRH